MQVCPVKPVDIYDEEGYLVGAQLDTTEFVRHHLKRFIAARAKEGVNMAGGHYTCRWKVC